MIRKIIQKNTEIFLLLSLIILVNSASVFSGSVIRNQFIIKSDGITDSSLISNGSLALGVKEYGNVKIFGDSLFQISNTTLQTDIIQRKDTIQFFNIDTLHKVINWRKYRIAENGLVALGNWTKFSDADVPNDCYFNGDAGETGNLLSFLKKGSGSTRYLRLHNGSTFIDLDSSNTTGWLFSSQCHLEKDTFLVVYSKDMATLQISKIYSNGQVLQKAGSSTVATGIPDSGKSILNCSVAFDKQGTILVSWHKGKPKGEKYLYFRFYSKDLTGGPSDSLGQIVADTSFYYVDNASIASYGNQKFALVYWDVNGLKIDRIVLNGGSIQQTSGNIVNGVIRSCRAVSNEKYLLIVCKGDINSDGNSGIEGIRYPISNGNFGTPEKFTYSKNGTPISTPDIFTAAINCILDSAGTMGVTWKNHLSNQGAIFVYRGIRHKNGFWTSPIESLSINYQDSLRYAPLKLEISDTSSWNFEDSVRTGCSYQQCLSAPWKSFSTESAMDLQKTTCRFYQYRIKINRKNANNSDSILTPVISEANVSWNVKPVIISLDSISVRNKTRTGVTFSSNLNIMSRIDTVKAFVKVRDQDAGDLVSIKGSWLSHDTVLTFTSAGTEKSLGAVNFFPLPYDTMVTCTVSIWDFQKWYGQSKTITITARNSLPQLTTKMSVSGWKDTITIAKDTSFLIQSGDSIEFFYNVSDTNDPESVKGYLKRSTVFLDSVQSGSNGKYLIVSDTLEPHDSLRMIIAARDPDTMVQRKMSIAINHTPNIRYVESSSQRVYNNDSMRIRAGIETLLNVSVNDTDVYFWDSLHYKLIAKTFTDSLITNKAESQFKIVPTVLDSQIIVIVKDRTGKSDSLRFFLKTPWLAVDSIVNPGFCRAKDTLQRYISLIAGSPMNDTIEMPIVNSGNDFMKIKDVEIKSKDNQWLTIIINDRRITSQNHFGSEEIILNPAEPLKINYIISASNMTGDSVIYDTVIIKTDELLHSDVIIPVKLEYNDLPVIVDVKTNFINDVPYWGLKKRSAFTPGSFPPHASIQVSFSEPVDSISVLSGVKIYSIKDYKKTGIIRPINTNLSWSQNYTKLDISSAYLEESPAYGILPPKGLFIPTDSLALNISNAVYDRATTPSGPNNLDIHRNFTIISYADTTFGMKVDSSTFTLLGITPLQGDTNVTYEKPEIVLSFSAPVYARSVDTSKVNNRTLIVRSRYNDDRQLYFDTIVINANNVTFRIAQKLFYRDSIHCLYRSNSVRNYSGYSIDNNHNGIPSAIFDSLSNEDDIEWSYRVKENRILSVVPVNGASVNQIHPQITIRFSDPIQQGTFDTDTSSSNRSIQISSLYSRESGNFSSITIASDSLSVIITPKNGFFSNDSVNCKFSGFSSAYTYNTKDNLPFSNIQTFSQFEWYFFTGNTGFYTYPNPYKPGKDLRHCNANGPCGIWFKNLHVLKRGINDVKIRIFDMNSNPVFDSKKKNILIHFETGDPSHAPQWLWDTRNMKNELVASGLYIYVIYDLKGQILLKDKLIIVR